MIYGATLSTVAAPDPIPDDDDLAVLMLALSPDMYLRHADVEGEFLADSSGDGNTGTVVGTMAAWGVDAELATPSNPERAITYGGTGSVTVSTLSTPGNVTYGIRFKPTASDISGSAVLFERAVSGNGAGYWGLRLLPGGAMRMFMQTGTPPSLALETATGLIEADKWAHVYVVLSSTGVYLLSGGAIVAENLSFTIGETGNDQPLKIGASFFTASLSGTVHEVVRYPIALTEAQIADRSFFDELAGPPIGGDTFAQMPATTSEVTVTNLSEFTAAVAAAPPGRKIKVAPGNYGFFSVTFGGSAGNPIIVCPSDKNNPPVFNGSNCQVYGTYAEFWGCIFDNTAFGASAGTKNVRIYGTDIRMMYCDIKPRGIGLEIASAAPRRTRFERCRFHSPATGGTGNGFEAVKMGVSTSFFEPHASVITLCLFQDIVLERECIGLKGETFFFRNHLIGCTEISFRYCRNTVVEENRIQSPSTAGSTYPGRIYVSGPDNVVRGNIGTWITCDRGAQDADSPPIPSTGSSRLNSKRALLQNNTMANGIRVGGDPFSTPLPIAVSGTTGSNNTPAYTLLNGATVGTAATVTSQTPPTLSSTTTGVVAYRNEVTAA